MKKFIVGLLIGILISTAGISLASTNIKLIVDGKEIPTDVPAQLISGRTMVPIRFIAEALGAEVEWSEPDYAVLITKKVSKTPQDDVISIATLRSQYEAVVSMKDMESPYIIEVKGFTITITQHQLSKLNNTIPVMVPISQENTTIDYVPTYKIEGGTHFDIMLLDIIGK